MEHRSKITWASWILTMGFLVTTCAPTWAAPGVEEIAQDILRRSGVRGGLVVHLGCGDGKLTAALRADERYLVQGWDRNPTNVERARDHIRSCGFCRQVSAELLESSRLPYVDNLVNLLLLEAPDAMPQHEVLRVLAPGGVAMVKNADGWAKQLKPWPEDVDEWTHFLHDASGNAVSRDRVVGPPRHLQWEAGPAYTRHHEHTTSITTIVSAGGRLFYIQDEAPHVSMFMPAKWFLVARDAFNGILLWKRPIDAWFPPLVGFRNNPAWLQRTLVAVGDRVYVTLGLGQPVTVLDAASGQTIDTYGVTAGAEEILQAGDRLFVVAGPGDSYAKGTRPASAVRQSSPRRIAVMDTRTGKLVWERADAETASLLPLTLAVVGRQLFFQNKDVVVGLDAHSGATQWRHPLAATRQPRSTVPPTLVVYDDIVLVADSAVRSPEHPKGELVALSARTGERLWSTPCGEGYFTSPDLFVADGLVWAGTDHRVGSENLTSEFSEGLDPLTGEVKRRLDTKLAFIDRPHHHRCYRNKATERFLFVGRHGVEMIPLNGDPIQLHDWLRGACRYGVLPCNGLLYTPPHACSCHINQLLGHFRATAPARHSAPEPSEKHADEQLLTGPAYADRFAAPSEIGDPGAKFWPTYRSDPARSGSTPNALPAALERSWTAVLGGKPTSPTVAEGRVFVAVPETHSVHAMDAATGKALWRFTAGGPVDTPPTLHQGRAIFGSRDGWVYCLRTSDGELSWRFRAAPQDLRLVADGQVESVWPVHGSVLVRNGNVYATAGRSSNLDGGFCLYRLDAETGRVVAKTRLKDESGAARGQTQGPSDVLSADAESLYMRFQQWSLADLQPVSVKSAQKRTPPETPRLICPTGFLDDSWFHRAFWTFGTSDVFGDPRTIGNRAPAGQLLVFDDNALYGYGRKPEYFMWTTPVEFRLFAAERPITMAPLAFAGKQPPQSYLRHPTRQVATRWSREIPLHVRAMLLAGDALFIAGPPITAKEGPPKTGLANSRLDDAQARKALAHWEGRAGALLWAVATRDGTTLAEYPLDALPTWDGMAAAQGRLYLSTTDGKVVCMSAKNGSRRNE